MSRAAALAAWLRFWKRPAAAQPPRPDRLRIAVLEHELFGIEPEPGTAAALVVALRRFGGGAGST